jgi:ubiquinone/menaquinone biosynthesis C-methylase UbiE
MECGILKINQSPDRKQPELFPLGGQYRMDKNANIEICRIKEVYKNRDQKNNTQTWREQIYHPRHPMGRLFYEHNYNILVDSLNKIDLNLDNLNILDFGCGTGAWLRLLIELGAKPQNITGIDISESRINIAESKNPSINWITSDGDSIPFESGMFDITMQVVVFSSIIDHHLANKILKEMLRVTKQGGYIFWIDHKKSHSSILTGYTDKQLIELLPGCTIMYKESVHPRYIRNWYNYPGLCRLFYNISKKMCDSWFLIFKKLD